MEGHSQITFTVPFTLSVFEQVMTGGGGVGVCVGVCVCVCRKLSFGSIFVIPIGKQFSVHSRYVVYIPYSFIHQIQSVLYHIGSSPSLNPGWGVGAFGAPLLDFRPDTLIFNTITVKFC